MGAFRNNKSHPDPEQQYVDHTKYIVPYNTKRTDEFMTFYKMCLDLKIVLLYFSGNSYMWTENSVLS